MVAALSCVLSLGACTSSNHPGTSGSPSLASGSTGQVLTTSGGAAKPVSPYCAKLRDAGQKLQTAEVQLYTSAGTSTAVSQLETELDALKSGAPSSIRSAIDDLAGAFRTAAQLLAHPTDQNKTALASIGSKLAVDGQKLTAYVTAQC